VSGPRQGGPPSPEQRRPSRIFSILMGIFGVLGGIGFMARALTTGPVGRNLAIGLVFGGLGALWLLTGIFVSRAR
jgi:hypothetical protein